MSENEIPASGNIFTAIIKAAYLNVRQSALIFKPMGDDNVSAPGILSIVRGLEGRLARHDIKTSDNVNIVVEYEAPVSEKQPLFIMFHGNTGHWKDVGAPKEGDAPYERDYRLSLIKEAVSKGAGVLVVSLRGYGLSSGTPSQKGFSRDVQAVADFACEKLGVPARKIITLGESMGAWSALELAQRIAKRGSPPALAGTIAAFEDLATRAHDDHGDIPLSWIKGLLRHPFDNMKQLDEFPKRTSLYIAHPGEDKVTRIRHGERLRDRAQANGLDITYKKLEGAGHVTWSAKEVIGDMLDIFYRRMRALEEKQMGMEPAPELSQAAAPTQGEQTKWQEAQGSRDEKKKGTLDLPS